METVSPQVAFNGTISAENITRNLSASDALSLRTTDDYDNYYDYYEYYYYDCSEHHPTIHPLLYPHTIVTNILALIGISKYQYFLSLYCNIVAGAISHPGKEVGGYT